ncbi:NAD(P)/FAD-dependent oxidoreductase [Speluncibacter jeojiensis]|uniref:NAD(P)/FAD-dependent oxidoreductase n=1 Tax=Speluncibacter jeojiensis TaxID=2710754 RepID=A0A9X4RDP6_9ACTN|nr:NAD(P)/FAD-dependent oxidoreductase [Corynebacteriales bacterium D3-21]
MDHHPIVIVGAGFGGIGLGAKLRQAGITDFTILERTEDLGGTWSRNTYPGAACDVPSVLYCYSFAPNPAWSHKYASQGEILDYLRDVAEKFGVTGHMRFGTEVESAVFDETTSTWQIRTNHGEMTADVLVTAVGAFTEASIPQLPGMDIFGGSMFHTLHWDHDHDMSGERVAVIGTGATAIQVIPAISDVADEVVVFQRTPAWIVPRLDRSITLVEKTLYSLLPLTQRLMRTGWYAAIESFGLPGFTNTAFRHPFEALGRLQLARQVSDPELRSKLTPDYMIGCKRAIFSDKYYPALCRDDVTVVTEGISEIREHSIVDGAGVEHAVDTIVFATGFTATPRVGDGIKGTDGRSVNDVYRDRPQSYLGVATAGFPNMFTILGRFGAAGNQSAVFMIEGQIDYIVSGIKKLRKRGITRFDLRHEVQDAFVDEVHRRSQHGTWLQGGCASYYTNGSGENSGLYPNWSFEYRHRTRNFDLDNYEVVS